MGPASADEDTQNASGPAAPAGDGAPSPTSSLAPADGPAALEASFSQAEEVPAEGVLPERLHAEAGPANAALEGPVLPELPPPSSLAAGVPRPSFVFFGVVAGLSLAMDIASKVWAEWTLNERGFEPLELIKDHLAITLAYNRGGAWGLFSTASDMVRKPFFLGVSVAAIAFIISLYARLTMRQKALKWGLPLVLGGALGNLNDRITRSQVIDFIDFRADWIMDLNVLIHRYVPSWAMTDHWPTFNVADVAICFGVGLMAVDMFTHRPRRSSSLLPVVPPAPPEVPPAMGPPAIG